MKKINIIITVLLTFFSFSGFSQLKVASDGKVGIGIGTNTPVSALSIGSAGSLNANLYVEGRTHGLITKRNGNPGAAWISGANCSAPVYYGRYNMGILASSTASSALGGRAWGVLAKAGNSSNGYNYGVMGTTYGTQSGAGIVGTTKHANGGYVYIFDNSSNIYAYTTEIPYSTNAHNRICTDADNDGYYWWGTGSKPDSCPVCAPSTPDGDDSNANLGPMDAYGNCTPISSPYTHPAHEVTSTETWQSTTTECGDVIVKNGGNLTINGATINMDGNAEFLVEIGGILTFNEGVIQ